MANYGKDTIGGSNETLSADNKRACKFTSPADISEVDSISVYANRTGTGSAYAIRGGIYTDASGAPDALVANSAIEISSNIARNNPQWYSANYTTKPTLSPNTVYWLCVQAAKASATYYDTGASNQEGHNADTYSDGLASSFGSPTYHAHAMSIYVSYTAGVTNFQTLAATALGTASLSMVITFLRTLTSTALGTASLTPAILILQTLVATALAVATLGRKLTIAQLLTATAIGTATLTRLATYARTLAATSLASVSISRIASYARSLSATALAVASVAKTQFLSLAATAMGTATMGAEKQVGEDVTEKLWKLRELSGQHIFGASEQPLSPREKFMQAIAHARIRSIR